MRDLEVQIDNAQVPVDFHVLDIKLNWNSSLLLGRAFLSTVLARILAQLEWFQDGMKLSLISNNPKASSM